MRQVKIAGREWDCSSLQYTRKIRGPETLTHTFTKRIEEKQVRMIIIIKQKKEQREEIKETTTTTTTKIKNEKIKKLRPPTCPDLE